MTNIYYFTALTVQKSLRSTIKILQEAQKWSLTSGKTEAELLEARLAPDMFPLKKQIQMISDNAKGMTSRFTESENPSYEDTETTFDDLIARLQKTLDYVGSFVEADFANSDSVKIILPYFKDKYQDAGDYLLDYAIPNFFFHKVTVYDILRNQGMPIGKNNYLGSLNLKDL
ncbi:MAG: DUF1993 domain-containing protein [bacterium]